jgi:hypothetical protein
MGLISRARREGHATRKLRIIAQDPGVRAADGSIITTRVTIPAEELLPGPTGYRVRVVDYDASTDTLYKEADVDGNEDLYADADNATLLTDPRFHAQNVYGIVMRTLSTFEKALGRRVAWGCDGHQIHVVPHAFAEPNAFYSREDRALFFGYFKGVTGNTIFASLAHDAVAHETTHGILDGLRHRYMEPSLPDQAAFHEAFADIVALLSIFSIPELIERLLTMDAPSTGRVPVAQLSREALKGSVLFGLADEMGSELSGIRGQALRRSVSLDPETANADSPEFQEEHRRGEILVAAMLNGFLDIWLARIAVLGTVDSAGGTPAKDLSAVVEMGARTADHLLTMAIRAIDYCPPVDLSFGDYLSALITIDKEVVPDDGKYGYRDRLLENFKRFRIEPAHGTEADGSWKRCGADLNYGRTHFDSLLRDPQEVFRFLWENRKALELGNLGYLEIESVRPSMRIDTDGFILRETVAEYVQILTLTAKELREQINIQVPADIEDGRRLRVFGGGTLIFDEYGQLKYQLAKHLAKDSHDRDRQARRIASLWERGLIDRPLEMGSRLANFHLARAGLAGANK